MEPLHFGDDLFNPDACELIVRDNAYHLQPQVSKVLLCLHQHFPDVTPRDTLIQEAWGNQEVVDESLTRCISILRKTLAKSGSQMKIETIPRVGYRLKFSTVSRPQGLLRHRFMPLTALALGCVITFFYLYFESY